VITLVKINMMYTISNEIGLEEFEGIRGLISFSINNMEIPKLQMEDPKPKLKTKTERIIVRDGRNKGNNSTELF
jgi:hypothetical protein